MFVDKSKELCNAIMDSKLQIHSQLVKVDFINQQEEKPQPRLCIEIIISTEEIKRDIFKLAQKHIPGLDLEILIDQNYECPIAACSPGIRIGNDQYGGSVGCYVKSPDSQNVMCITCQHCIQDMNDIRMNCQGGEIQGTYCHGTIDERHDICVISLEQPKNISNEFTCLKGKIHQLREIYSGEPLELYGKSICKVGKETKKSKMTVLWLSVQYIEYNLDDGTKHGIKNVMYLGKFPDAAGKYKRDEIFDKGDSGSVAVICDDEKCQIAGILFAKVKSKPSNGQVDRIALMHPLHDYFCTHKLSLI